MSEKLDLKSRDADGKTVCAVSDVFKNRDHLGQTSELAGMPPESVHGPAESCSHVLFQGGQRGYTGSRFNRPGGLLSLECGGPAIYRIHVQSHSAFGGCGQG